MNMLIIIASGALALAAAHPHPGGLPLTRGVYVETGTPCREAPMSARSWFGDGYVIQGPHVRCEATHVRRSGLGQFVVSEICRDEMAPDQSYRVTNSVRVISPTEYQIENRFGRFQARWCRD